MKIACIIYIEMEVNHKNFNPVTNKQGLLIMPEQKYGVNHPKRMSFQYRDHRGSLAESMETVQTFESYNALVEYLQKDLAVFGVTLSPEHVDIQPYGGIDERIGWDTHIVTAKVNGESMVCGFTDQWVLPILNTKFVVHDHNSPPPETMRRFRVSMRELGATRKDDDTITIRLRPRPPSKLSGRRGTRRAWKRNHPPVSVDVRVSIDEENRISLGVIQQRLLSGKHL